jgi:hypothetical protein
VTWSEYKAMLDDHPSMVERRLQCEIDGHFTTVGVGNPDQPWMGAGRHTCLVCGEEINPREETSCWESKHP